MDPHDLAEREGACADGMCPLCLAAQLTEARAVLREVEWTQLRGVELDLADGMMFCPTCHAFTKRIGEIGHAPDCRLAKIIGK